jgi:YD repeat-containing protein
MKDIRVFVVKKNCKLTITMYFLFTVFVNSQGLNPPVNMPSPNATSLGKYGDIPVSYYTGTPNISVPLFEINDFNTPLKIALNYNASGVRVNSMPGWVGQNWSLQAGGMITRTIKNFVDEHKYGQKPDEPSSYHEYGYFYSESHNQLNIDDWNSEDAVYNKIKNADFTKLILRDLEPDIFTFNFMGHSGKFFMGHDGEFKVLSTSNLKISIDLENDLRYPFDKEKTPFNDNANSFISGTKTIKAIYKIKITDGLGTTYIFGNTKNSVEYSTNLFYHWPGDWSADTWYLTKVIDKYQNTVYEFKYERDTYITGVYKSFTWQNGFFKYDNSGEWLGLNCPILTPGNYYEHPLSGRLISPVYLKQIETINDTIYFDRVKSCGVSYADSHYFISEITHPYYFRTNNYSGNQKYFIEPPFDIEEYKNQFQWKKLTTIRHGSKTIRFEYNDDCNQEINQRLNLLSINIGKEGYDASYFFNSEKTYSFEYQGIEELPEYLSDRTDHWGYCKIAFYPEAGRAGYPYIIDKIDDYENYYDTRITDKDNVKKGMLSKIIYPSKGWTIFEWEANEYTKYVSDHKSTLYNVPNTPAGGVRIAKITNHDGRGNNIVRNFRYSDGIIEMNPRYYWKDFRAEKDKYKHKLTKFTSNPILPLSNYTGTHIGYAEVTEEKLNGGSTTYKYTSNEDPEFRDEYHGYSHVPNPSPYTNYSDKSLLRGHLKEIAVRDTSNYLVQETIRNYNYDSNQYARSVYKSYASCGGSAHSIQFSYAYKLYYFDSNLTKEDRFTYDQNQNNYIKTTSSYKYNANNLISEKTFTNSKNQTQTIKTYYPDDIISTDQFEHTFIGSNQIKYIDSLKSTAQHRINTPIYSETYKNDVLISKQQNVYKNSRKMIVLEKVQSSKSTSIPEDKVIYHSYDDKGNPIEISKKDGTHTLFLWGYNQQYPIAKIENATYDDLMVFKYHNEGNHLSPIYNASNNDNDRTQNYDGNEGKLREELEVLRTYFSNAQVTTYTYDPLIGVTSSTDPRGQTVYYEYDAFNRLEKVKDQDGRILTKNEYHYKNQ